MDSERSVGEYCEQQGQRIQDLTRENEALTNLLAIANHALYMIIETSEDHEDAIRWAKTVRTEVLKKV